MKRAVLVVREFDLFSALLNENGFETINLPLVRTVAVEDLSNLSARLSEIENYDGVFLTSPAAAHIFLQGFGERHFAGEVYILGERIRRMMETTKLKIVQRERANTISEFLATFPSEEFAGKRFLFPRGDKSLRTIAETLGATAEIDEVVVYRTIKPEVGESLLNEIKAKISRDEISAACFFSPSGIDNFLETFGAFSPNNIKIAAIGATTARAAQDRNLKVDYTSPRANAEDFARGLAEYLKSLD